MMFAPGRDKRFEPGKPDSLAAPADTNFANWRWQASGKCWTSE